MKTEEKLMEFRRASKEKAESMRRNSLNEINARIKQEATESIKKAELESKNRINEEFHKLSQERNRSILEAKNSCKEKLVNLRKEYYNSIFENVERELYNFTRKEEYKFYLAENIKRNYIKIYFTKRDMLHADFIKERVGFGIEILESDDDFIGGFKAVLPNKNIMIDNSFKSKLLEEREKINVFRIV